VTLTPKFELKSYRLEVRIDGPGTISSNGTACAPTDTWDWCASFKHGATATLTAEPAAGSIFTYWSGNPCTGFDPTCSLTVTEAATFQAVFGKVSISLDTKGSGTACATSGASLCITEGLIPPVSNFIAVGTTLVIEARPAKGWRFDHWNSGPCGGQGATCTFTVKTAKSLVATFTRIQTATPKPTAKPTATPRATATPRPSPRASSAAAPTVAPTEGVTAGPSLQPAASGAPVTTTADPGTTGIPGVPPSDQAAAPAGSGLPAASDAATVPAASVDAGGGGDLTVVLLLIAAVTALLLGLGFLAGRRVRRAARSGPAGEIA
jgi:hypothetical protein